MTVGSLQTALTASESIFCESLFFWALTLPGSYINFLYVCLLKAVYIHQATVIQNKGIKSYEQMTVLYTMYLLYFFTDHSFGENIAFYERVELFHDVSMWGFVNLLWRRCQDMLMSLRRNNKIYCERLSFMVMYFDEPVYIFLELNK